jgi:hypothetical protein
VTSAPPAHLRTFRSFVLAVARVFGGEDGTAFGGEGRPVDEATNPGEAALLAAGAGLAFGALPTTPITGGCPPTGLGLLGRSC